MVSRAGVGRLVIADGDADWRSLLRGLLVHGGFDVVGETEDLGPTIRTCVELEPDVLLLDLELRGGHLPWGLSRIERGSPRTLIVGLLDLLVPVPYADLPGVERIVRKSLGVRMLSRELHLALPHHAEEHVG